MDDWTAIRTLIDLMRQSPLRDRPIDTLGELGDALDAAYRAKRYGPAPPKPVTPAPPSARQTMSERNEFTNIPD